MSPSRSRRSRAAALVVGAGLASAGLTACSTSVGTNQGASPGTQIQHLVVIYQENVSFDHYFGSYPVAANSSGSRFSAAPDTPTANGLTGPLLTANPNGANPRRLDPATIGDVLTCDQDHNYTDEQKAFDNGKMDRFPQTVGAGSGKSPGGTTCAAPDVMNYYDGNTVTAFWNYAQRYAMNDNSFGTTFGPSSPARSTWSPAEPVEWIWPIPPRTRPLRPPPRPTPTSPRMAPAATH